MSRAAANGEDGSRAPRRVARRESLPGGGSADRSLRLDDPIEVLPRIGPARAAALRAIGVVTLRDLLFVLPCRHRARSPERTIAAAIEAASGGDARSTIRGVVTHHRSGRRRGAPSWWRVSDATGSIEIVSFAVRRVPRSLTRGCGIVVEGRCEIGEGGARIVAAHHAAAADEPPTAAPRPQYDLPAAIPPRDFARWIRRCLPLAAAIEEPRPSEELARVGALELAAALRAIHAPDDDADLEAARRRFALDEIAERIAPLAARRRALARFDKGRRVVLDPASRDELWSRMPFAPTVGQRAAFDAIADDLGRSRPMHRLLQGEVGSGKTAVALLAALAVARAGHPTALLAPTSPLVRQHVRAARDVFSGTGIPIHEFSNAVLPAERRAIASRLRTPHPCLVVGTLRLLSVLPGVALAVIDEQQRFGVSQRARLRADPATDLLVMTATPIPRSLALVLYGDLDVSVMRERPADRKAVATRSLPLGDGSAWRAFVRDRVEGGGRVFVVCPRISGDPDLALHAVDRALRSEFSASTVAVAHGERRAEDNARAFERFRNGDARILLTTVLVEVGIDVPDANAIVILGAERFGLAQLHQLRGRVGRGASPGTCLLVAAAETDSSRERIGALLGSDCGFEIAEADLRLRGAGELAGDRQHGAIDFRFARLPRDLDLVPLAFDRTAPKPSPSARTPHEAWQNVGPG